MTVPTRTVALPSDGLSRLAEPARRAWLLAALAGACALPRQGLAQVRFLPADPVVESGAGDWPSRAVKLVVPFPAGGGTDALAQPLAAEFAHLTGQALQPDYQGGLGGTRGAKVAAGARPDGYTLLMGGVHHVIAPALRRLDYDLDIDLVPLALLATVPQVLVVRPNRFPNNFAGFLNTLMADPNRYSYGSAGSGTSHHVAGALFARLSRTRINHLPFRGAGPALAELMAGNVDMVFDGLASSAPHIRAGRLKALMVSGARRNPAIPYVPCATELGLLGFDVNTWYGLWAPKGTPADLRARMVEMVQRLSETQAIQIAWMDAGAEFPALTGAAFGDFIDAETQRWAKLVKTTRVQLD